MDKHSHMGKAHPRTSRELTGNLHRALVTSFARFGILHLLPILAYTASQPVMELLFTFCGRHYRMVLPACPGLDRQPEGGRNRGYHALHPHACTAEHPLHARTQIARNPIAFYLRIAIVQYAHACTIELCLSQCVKKIGELIKTRIGIF